MSRAGRRGLTLHDRPLRDRLAELASEVDAVPAKQSAGSKDSRGIVGYSEHGR